MSRRHGTWHSCTGGHICPRRYTATPLRDDGIILVQQQSEPPEDAKILAQASLQGGGDLAEAESPSTPLPAPFPHEEPEIAAPPPIESQPPAESAADAPEIIAETEPEPTEVAEQIAVETIDAEERLAEKIDVKDEKAKLAEEVAKQKIPDENVRDRQVPEKPALPPTPSATALMTNSFQDSITERPDKT